MPFRVPDTPANVTVTPGDSQITISWDAPTDISVTSHNIYTNAWGTINIPTPETSYTVGATNGVTYTGIYVRAVNADGESIASSTFSITPGPTSPPNTPTGFTSYLNASIHTLSWDGPSGLPSVQGYNIYINGDLYTSLAPTTTSTTIPNLVPGLTYNITLVATNTMGESDPTSTISITPQNLPNYPVISNLTPYNSRLYLSWLATGQTLSAYKVYLSTTGVYSTPVTTVSGTTLSADIDLTNVPEFADGVWYGVVVTAVDANGLESIKQAVTGFAATTSPVPSPVNMLTATPMNSSISVSWSQPIYAGATPPILSYTVHILDQVSSNLWAITGITGLSTIIPGLINERTYTLSVTAVSDDGESPPASTYIGYIGELNATPGTTPGNPENITATSGDGSFVVSWTPPSYTGESGGPILGYKVYVSTDTGINAPVDVSAASTTYTATGLTNGTNYYVRVSAVSSDGESFDFGAQASLMVNILPAAPSVSVAAIDSGLVIGWTPSTANNAAISDYILYINGSLVSYINATLSYTIIRPLTNGTSYNVRVSGYNNIGEGPQSSLVSGTPAPASPGPIIVSGALAAYVGAVPSTLTFGSSVTSISATALNDPLTGAAPTNVTSINLASTNIRVLPSAIFSGFTGLTSVTVPPTLTSIGLQAFNGCANLSTINLSSTSVTTIEGEAFQGCSSLTSISLPASLTSIGDNTFQGCSNLESIDLSATGITSLGGIFNGCSSLTSVLLPTGLLTIGVTFNSLSALTSLTIPSGVTSIATNAFNGCTSLSSINLPLGLLTLGENVFNGCPPSIVATIPASFDLSIWTANLAAAGFPGTIIQA
jgi:hypothetical protein